MANSDIIARVFSPVFQEIYHQENIWLGLVRDFSNELEFGDRIELPSDALTGYTPQQANSARLASQLSPASAADVAWGTPTVTSANKVDLIVNKLYELDTVIGRVAEGVVRPSLLESAVRHSAREFNEVINDDIRKEFDTAGSGQQVSNISVTAANFGNDAHVTAIIKAFRDASKSMNVGYLPKDNRYVVMSPAYYDLTVNWLIEEKLFLVQGGTDMAVINNTVPRFRGFDIYSDNSMASAETASSANHFMYWGLRGEGIGHAMKMRYMNVFESEQYKGMRAQSQVFYGNLINQPSKIRLTKTTIT